MVNATVATTPPRPRYDSRAARLRGSPASSITFATQPQPCRACGRRFLLAEDARRTLALLGAPEAVWAVVQSLWPTLDPALRHRCTFDTHFQGGNIARTPYALVGLTQEPTNARFDVYPLPRR